VFEEEGALEKLEGFASVNGAQFYRLPLNEGTVILDRADVQVPDEIDGIVPFHAGETLRWKVRV
jgi:dihydroorotase